MKYKKPKSWKEAGGLPFISSIEKDSYPEPNEMYIFIQLENGINNPVTGETGGGFYVADFQELVSQLFHFWEEQA